MANPPAVLDYGESTYEQDFWLNKGRAYEDAVERQALRRLLPANGERLVDVGAGFGRLAGLYSGYRQRILLDYSPDLLRDARKRLAPDTTPTRGYTTTPDAAPGAAPDATPTRGYTTTPDAVPGAAPDATPTRGYTTTPDAAPGAAPDTTPTRGYTTTPGVTPGPLLTLAANFYDIPLADGACDTAVMVRVLHHAEDVPAVLRELRRILKPGGILVLEHANKRHLKALLRYALGRGPNPSTLAPFEFATLNFDFHPAYIRRELAQAGFAVERERAVSILRVNLLKRLLPTRLLAGLDTLLQRPLAPLHLAPSVFLRCRAIGDAGQPEPTRPLFRCPRCHSTDLGSDDPDRLLCRQCGSTWLAIDGIYRFR